MAKVRARVDTKKLFIDFRYQGIRCREQTLLSDTARNRKQLETLIQRMEAKMLVGDFDYAEFFPGSKNLKKLEDAGVLPKNGEGVLGPSESTTPFFTDFADQWFLESKIQWRNSHTRNVESILASSLKPAFKDKRVGEISKPDILAARNKMARRKGRGASGLMSPKTINSHMTILRMILTEAAERFDFANPYLNIKPLK